jgi:hypothetical protein
MAEFALRKYIECKVRWIDIQYSKSMLKCCEKFRQTQWIAKINLHVEKTFWRKSTKLVERKNSQLVIFKYFGILKLAVRN